MTVSDGAVPIATQAASNASREGFACPKAEDASNRASGRANPIVSNFCCCNA